MSDETQAEQLRVAALEAVQEDIDEARRCVAEILADLHPEAIMSPDAAPVLTIYLADARRALDNAARVVGACRGDFTKGRFSFSI